MTFSSHYPRTFRLLIILSICLTGLQAHSQDALPAEETSPAEAATPPPTFTSTPTLMLIPSDIPTEIPTDLPTTVPTDIPTLQPTATDDLPPSSEPSLTPSPEITATETPYETPLTPTLLWSPTPTPIAEIVLTLESPTPEMTSETPSPSPTEGESPTPVIAETVVPSPSASPTKEMEMVIVSGMAHYQNRLPDDSGIRIEVFDPSGQVLGEALTNAAGTYKITVPAGESFVLRVEGDRHLAVEWTIHPGEPLPEMGLMGGDLNGDGCIGAADVGLLTLNFEQPNSETTDITGDGVTDDADLAILAGNYAPDCEPATLPIETPTVSSEATYDVGTPTPAETLNMDTATPEAQITVEPTEEKATAEANPIMDGTPSATPTELVITAPAVEAGS